MIARRSCRAEEGGHVIIVQTLALKVRALPINTGLSSFMGDQFQHHTVKQKKKHTAPVMALKIFYLRAILMGTKNLHTKMDQIRFGFFNLIGTRMVQIHMAKSV